MGPYNSTSIWQTFDEVMPPRSFYISVVYVSRIFIYRKTKAESRAAVNGPEMLDVRRTGALNTLQKLSFLFSTSKLICFSGIYLTKRNQSLSRRSPIKTES